MIIIQEIIKYAETFKVSKTLKVFCQVFVFLLFAILFFISCDYKGISVKERTKRASESKGDIVIGVVNSSLSKNFFFEGTDMALEEINQQGGVIGRKIKPLFYDDQRTIKKGRKIAWKLSRNPDVIAVLGHRYSGIAIPVSATYEKNGILFISPGASIPTFTNYGGKYTFRNIPSDEEFGRQMADFCYHRGFKNIVVIYERRTIGRMLSEIFHERATDLGIKIVSTKSYFGWQDDFRQMISELIKEHDFDAVFLAGLLPLAGKFIKQARDTGINVPFIVSSNLDSPELLSVAGDAAEGVIVPTVFNPGYPSRVTRDFVKRFEAKFGVPPDIWAAQGYDGIRLLAHAIEESYSTVPVILASTLRIVENWQSVTDSYSFEASGDITGKSIFFKEIRNSRFEFVKYETGTEKQDPFFVVEETTLRLPIEGVISTIDPGLSRDLISVEVIEQLFLGLTDLDPVTYKAVPELATHWMTSDDRKTYVFHLRSDVTWTDGKPVTAYDIEWAIQRNLRPETNCPSASMLYVLKNAQAVKNGDKDPSEIGVKAINNFSIVFELEHPASYFPTMAGLWVYRPLPRHIIEEYGDRWTQPEIIQSNGSYMLAAWKKGMEMILKKNPDYYEAENVSIPEIRYYVIPESSVGMAMYENNELDIMGSLYLRLPPMEIPRIQENTVLSREYSKEAQFSTYAYSFNTKRPPVDNPDLRKAISAAIDRELLIKLVTRGSEEMAATFTRPPVFGSVDPKSGIGITFNPVKAKKWLDKALDKAGYSGPGSLPKITLMYNASETHAKIAEAVKASVKHYLDIDIELYEAKWGDYAEAATGPNPPHMFRTGWSSDYPDASNWLNEVFHPKKLFYNIGWENKEFAELMDKAEMEKDMEKRKAYYKRAEQILCEEEAAVVPIYFEPAHCLVKPRIKGWYHMAMGGQHIRDWSFKK